MHKWMTKDNMEPSSKLQIEVSLIQSPSPSSMERDWQELYQRAKPNVYLCWPWIKNWLALFARSPLLIRARKGEQIVGLALFEQRQIKLLPFLAIDQLWLHRCGNDKGDQIWIELNGFLLAQDCEHQASAAMLDFIAHSQHLRWQELYVGLSDASTLRPFIETFPHHRVEVDSLSFEVDLTKINQLDDYMACLSRNTRGQIKRSRRLLEQGGELRLSMAQTPDSKQQFFSEMASIHRSRWRNTVFGSGFDNPPFVQFHQQMTLADTENKLSRLYRLSIDHTTLGYVYLLLDGIGWNFYLSAIELNDNNQIKVGLVMHTMIIEQAIIAGQRYYNFLAGDAQYKRSLSNSEVLPQQLLCFYKPSTLLKCREALRKLKNKLIQPKENLDAL